MCIVSHTEMINQYEKAGSGVGYYHSPQCNNVASHQDKWRCIRGINNSISLSSMLITQQRLCGCMQDQVTVKHPLWKPDTLGECLCARSGCSNSWSFWKMRSSPGWKKKERLSNSPKWTDFIIVSRMWSQLYYRLSADCLVTGFSWNSLRAQLLP